MKKSLIIVLIFVSVGTVGYIFFIGSELFKNKNEITQAGQKNIHGEETHLLGIIPSNGKFVTVTQTTYDPAKDPTIEKKKDEAEVDFSVIEECKKAIEESDVNLAYFYPWHAGDKLILNGIDTGISAGNYYSGLEILNLKLDGKNTLFRKKVGFDYYDVYNGKETKVGDKDAKESVADIAISNKLANNCSIKNYKEVVCNRKIVWEGELAESANAFISSGSSYALINSDGYVIYNGKNMGISGNGVDRIDGAYLLPSCLSDKHILFDKGTNYDGDTTYSLDGKTEFVGSNPSVEGDSFVYVSEERHVIFNGVDCGKGELPVLSPK